jgi:sulfonate transport system substrate-binding protein
MPSFSSLSFISRRKALAWLTGGVLAASAALVAPHAAAAQPLRIGYQKSASLLTLLKAQGSLEKRLAPLGVEVKWVEFPAGPQLLEGLNIGAVDPASPEAEAIVVPKDSTIRSVAELKGKRVALNKGSNVHYLLVKLLEKHGLKYTDIQVVFLPPADARAAFERGAVDAWAIWDPFLAATEKQIGARVLADGSGVVNNFFYYLAARDYAKANGKVLDALFDEINSNAVWLKANIKEAAARIAPEQGLAPEVVELALRRYQFNAKPVTDAIIAEQQKLADTFFELKLIPKRIEVRQASVLANR